MRKGTAVDRTYLVVLQANSYGRFWRVRTAPLVYEEENRSFSIQLLFIVYFILFYLKHKYTEHKLKTWLKFVTSPGLHNRLISRDLTVRKYGTSTLPPCKQCLDVVHVMVARSVVERQSLTGEFSLACSTS